MTALKTRILEATAAMRSGALRSVGVLVGGTAAAHMITALSMPISTRLFSPADFSAAAVFAGLAAILTVAACLRFDMAIPLPESDAEAANLLGLAIIFSAVTALAVATVLAIIPASVLEMFRQPSLLPHLWLLPVATLIGGVYLALQMWHVRSKGFGGIARSRIVQSGAAATGQICLGWLGQAPLGLIVGQVLNYGAGFVMLLASAWHRQHELLRSISWAGMATAFRTYQRFPRYSVWEALANAAAINVPVLMIAALAKGPEAGYLTLAIFLLQAPMALLGNAVGQVFLSGAPEAYRAGKLAPFTLKSLNGLVRAATGPMIFLAIVSPFAFELVFGPGWSRAGVLVTWMVPWFLLQFISSPVSTALHVVGRQRTAMILQIVSLVARVGAVAVAGAAGGVWISEAYAISGAVIYGAYLWTVLRVVGIRPSELRPVLWHMLPFSFAAAIAGGLCAGVFSLLWHVAAL
jgi:O-antigen/teichoic acid export membrane protein